jgi:hypothetical protein
MWTARRAQATRFTGAHGWGLAAEATLQTEAQQTALQQQ